MSRVFAALVSLLLLARGAAAEEEPMARARAHFEAGRALYTLGNYQDALREFTSGNAIAPRPRFLLNIAHCQRRLGQLDKSRDSYRAFLDSPGIDASDRKEAQQYLDEVTHALAEKSAAPPETTPLALEPPPTTVAVTATAIPPATSARSESPRSHRLKHLAWILPVGAVVVTGVVLGVYFGTRSGDLNCSAATLGCYDYH
jgi:hypothetical protein